MSRDTGENLPSQKDEERPPARQSSRRRSNGILAASLSASSLGSSCRRPYVPHSFGVLRQIQASLPGQQKASTSCYRPNVALSCCGVTSSAAPSNFRWTCVMSRGRRASRRLCGQRPQACRRPLGRSCLSSSRIHGVDVSSGRRTRDRGSWACAASPAMPCSVLFRSLYYMLRQWLSESPVKRKGR